CVRQELFVRHGTGATVVAWMVDGPDEAVQLNVRPLLSGRDYHATHHENGVFDFQADVADASVAFQPYTGLPATIVLSNGEYEHAPDWYRNFAYREESERGLDAAEDLGSPGVFRWHLRPGERAIWVLTAGATREREPRSRTDLVRRYERERSAEIERRAGFAT